MIEAKSADGVIHSFPDDTDSAVIDKAMKEYVEKQAPVEPTPGDRLAGAKEKVRGQVIEQRQQAREFGHGFMDPVVGGRQLVAETLPSFMVPAHEREAPRERERQIAAERGADKDKMDWARMAGRMPLIKSPNPISEIRGNGLPFAGTSGSPWLRNSGGIGATGAGN